MGVVQDLLDAWLACQATWLYLEPIFSSADIVKQMPEEGEKFAAVDASWREVMARAMEAPAALPLGRDDEALNSLRECNGLLDEIQKGLAAYLEKKRLFFPRCDSKACAGCRQTQQHDERQGNLRTKLIASVLLGFSHSNCM